MFGQCVGMGDAFNLIISARPGYKDGHLRLQDVNVVSDGKTGFYIRRVCSATGGQPGPRLPLPSREDRRCNPRRNSCPIRVQART